MISPSSPGRQFNGFTENTVNFLKNIAMNNNRSWFEANKGIFADHVIRLFRDLTADLYPAMTKIDPQFETRPEKIISRIYRDTRFSRDKSPYKSTVWITYKRTNKNWQDYPAYFFELSGRSYRYGMGFYSATRTTMDAVRARIEKNPDLFLTCFIKTMKKNIFVIEGDLYKKTIPNGLSGELQAWYQRKNIYLACNRDIDSDLFSGGIVSSLIKGFEILAPLYYFLLKARE